jgi:uncharacterized protein YegJ (DUF2314 family)
MTKQDKNMIEALQAALKKIDEAYNNSNEFNIRQFLLKIKVDLHKLLKSLAEE